MILNPERKRILSARLRYLIFPLASLAVVGALLVPGRPANSEVVPLTINVIATNNADDEQDLLDLFRRFDEAAARGDYSLAKQVGLGEIIRTDGDRAFIVLKERKFPNDELLQLDVENVKVSVKGDSATVTYIAKIRLKPGAKGQNYNLSGHLNIKFKKRDGQWEAVYTEKTPPHPAPKH